MRSRNTEPLRSVSQRRVLRWLWPATLLALAPKCALCVLAYVGLGAAFGLGGPEVCGGAADSLAPWTSVLAWLGAGGGLVILGLLAWIGRAGRPF